MIKRPDGVTIGLGALSWRGHASLIKAFKTYQAADLFSLFDDAIVFMPDPDDDIRRAVARFDVRAEESPDNLGILVGMEQIALRLKTDYILFTENDCPLMESREEAARQIGRSLELLHDDSAIMARMRHTKYYGETFDTIDKYKRYHPDKPNLTATLRRLLRPSKARRLSGTSLYAGPGHAERFPKDIIQAGDDFYLVSTKVMPWTNQSILIRRSVFLDTIIPYCKSIPLDRGINGFRSVEIELNGSDFWTQSGWKIACGKGLFTHERANDRGY
jgi:hypothetical protein